MKYAYVIGIDCGVNTGLAIWSCQNKDFDLFGTYKIHQAFEIVKDYFLKGHIFLRVEDARKRGNSSKNSSAMAQGVGSVKRDAKIWEDFLMDHGIPFEMLAPKNTKVDVAFFEKATKIKARTSNHCRDACMMVLNYNG
jgi:hypothetical protein